MKDGAVALATAPSFWVNMYLINTAASYSATR